MTEENGAKKRMPAWLLGLLLAAVIFIVVIVVLQALGFGDDPAIESALDALPKAL